MSIKSGGVSDSDTALDLVYEIPIKQKLSSSRFVNRVLFPLLLLSLFYCFICYEILAKYGFSTAIKFAVPLIPIGLGMSVYFKTHTTKRSAKLEFNEQWVSYYENDTITGYLIYRVRSIKSIKRNKQGITIYGDIEKIQGSNCENQKQLCIDLSVDKTICERLKMYINR